MPARCLHMSASTQKIEAGIAPMEAKLVEQLPSGAEWQFEPKWDGFRCIAFRDNDGVELMSKSGKSLARFFPEVVAMFQSLATPRFVIDGELVIPVGEILSFDALQARLHPAESRIRRLSVETPAQFIAFDCLANDETALIDQPLVARRAALEAIFARENHHALLLSPATRDADLAKSWLDHSGGALDGVVAKRLDLEYRPGERAMLKVKQRRSADCVIGGFRYDRAGKLVASLLLGLYDDKEKLNHVGFTSGMSAAERARITPMLSAMIAPPGFTGDAPGGPSRWSTERSAQWQPVRPELVVEVLYDQVTARRFRHGTRLLRWRPDKAPRQCRMDQLQHELRPAELLPLMEADNMHRPG